MKGGRMSGGEWREGMSMRERRDERGDEGGE